ncbi:MAG TPA: glycoside hydrolase family 19 protein [Pyrinomonadaceae bacterium]|nr:glycoside hydrolase family 19 protein [Pyrinomonadaceae bacterium]
MITDDELRRVLPALPDARRQEFLPLLQSAMTEFGITTRLREAAFIAQISHESAGLTRLVENLNYSARRLMQVFPRRFPTLASANAVANNPERIANSIYANRIGNGPPESGDGFRYRGRGFIQLTGRANYREFGRVLGIDLEGDPDQAATPAVAFRIAAAFWKSRGCNEAADRDDIRTVTRLINGGTVGLAERTQLYNRAKQILSEDAGQSRGLISRGLEIIGLGGSETAEGRDVPPDLSRGIMPGAPDEEGGAAEEESSGARRGARTGASKKTAAKGAAKKAAGKAAGGRGASKKGGARKGGAKRGGAKKSAAGKGGAKKGGGAKGGAGKGSKKSAKKSAAKKGVSRKSGRR